MLETASPDHVLPDANPLAASPADGTLNAPSSDAPHAEPEGREAAGEARANGHGQQDATPAQTNGYVPQPAEAVDAARVDDSERPAKRLRTRNATPPPPAVRKLKPISPPWKKIEADGPTSFTENGRRKSGRINLLSTPVEPPNPNPKRNTRHSMNGSNGSTTKDSPLTNGKSSKTAAVSAPKQKPTSKTTSASTTPSESNSRHASKRGTAAPEPRSSSRLTRRRTPSPPPQPLRHSTRTRRTRLSDAIEQEAAGNATKHNVSEGSGKSPRVKLRVGSRLGVIPLVHPDQVRKRPRIGTDFDDFWNRAGDIPVEDGGLMVSEDGPPYTDEAAQHDARIILRIEKEVEPGGLLSMQRCSLFVPEGEEEPPRQWARQDHMTKAAANFRKLMVAEQQRHRSTAKKLAEACREEWLRRQPKTAEEIEAEARASWLAYYRVVLRSLYGTWENVRAEVNRRRLIQWEAEEQKRVKAALNQAVSLSEQKLQARRAGGIDSESLYDEDGFDDLTDSASEDEGEGDESRLSSAETDGSGDGDGDDDSDMMSSSEDEEDEDHKDAADEGLTQEQLRAKYANIPNLEREDAESTADKASRTPGNADDSEAETSDESVDMDDDLGSSDFDGSDESGDEGSTDESGSEEEAGGLLGLFFGKSELKAMKKGEAKPESPEDEEAGVQADASGTETKQPDLGMEEDDDDEMSLVHHPDSVNGDNAKEVGDNAGPLTPATETKLNGLQSSKQLNDEQAKKYAASSEPAHTDLKHVDEDVPMVDVPEPAASGEPKSEEPAATEAPEQDAHPQVEAANVHSETAPGTSSPTTAEAEPKLEMKPSETEAPPPQEIERAESSTAVTRVSTPQLTGHKVEVPFLLRGTLREYQRQGLDWLAGLYANNTNGILADEMGLGKTIQTIALLAHLACHHEVWGPHLVIVPTSWCPGFKILAYYGSQEERKRKRQGWNNDDVWNVCVTSYQLVLQDQQVFRRRRWHYMILDEAHNIKNFKSQRWQTLLGFNTHSRLLLTGTPLQNNLTELWSLLFFLMPAENGVGGFADLQEFHDWFRKPESQILENGRDQMDDEAKAIISKLHKVLRPYLLRRLKADHRELYDGFLARSDTRDTLASGNYLSIINCLMQLRKVCNHPDLFSVPAEYQDTVRVVQRTVNLGFLNLADSITQLSSHRILMDLREAQKCRAQNAYTTLDPSTVESNIAYLQHCVYLNALRRQQRPIYGSNVPRPQVPKKVLEWFDNDSAFLRALSPSLEQRADSLKTTIEKFSCVTPAVVTRDLNQVILGRKGLSKPPPADPWHEARMRLTIQFPDKRLLQYDCGKLQALDKLLRKLQAGGHRALIFTQMTKVLDILEQFLNIHGHKYLRLDGATKIEQRQILTDRFNHDSRLGINLTDWNPAMDKQCQDRCHRIGQTRDVHIYRLVSEHTIEANILRKASQKQMLDDVVIQEGEFNTDSFNRPSVRDVLGEKVDFMSEGVAAADAALDLRRVGRVFEQAEDKEDVAAARVAEKEILADDADFTEKPGGGASGTSTARQGTPAGKSIFDGAIGILDGPVEPGVDAIEEYNAWGGRMGNIDDYMLSIMTEELKHTKLELPKDKKKGKKKGKDTRKR
ncbi:hypothetical protein BBK36DRAFT_1135196 [Trichoderma citrinoviride]|uniref:DNA helicase n=1 Tax=Trichoderma citrinoviride TaxID=58853 RepID=A0A2T4BC33_9HYPO|nr:hypothetical protein BBK36DRAFT_1135196 [Trichoderma citrinoviride]PTB66890.1 hypothetical protein BBK36DRAFT_1135196 [Trichoderma citrinoviride]